MVEEIVELSKSNLRSPDFSYMNWAEFKKEMFNVFKRRGWVDKDGNYITT